MFIIKNNFNSHIANCKRDCFREIFYYVTSVKDEIIIITRFFEREKKTMNFGTNFNCFRWPEVWAKKTKAFLDCSGELTTCKLKKKATSIVWFCFETSLWSTFLFFFTTWLGTESKPHLYGFVVKKVCKALFFLLQNLTWGSLQKSSKWKRF